MGLWSVIEDQVTSSIMILSLSLLKMTTALLAMVHVLACVWYFIGDSTRFGWTSYFGVSSYGNGTVRNVIYWYFASSRCTLAQINGRTDMDDRCTFVEMAYTCAVAVGFAVVF